MKAKEFMPASKPRNFVAKNQKTGGAGAHKDKKKAEKQGYEKHKNKVEETELRDKGDLQAKRKALQDLQMDPVVGNDKELSAAVMQRKSDLEKEAKAKGMAEGTDFEMRRKGKTPAELGGADAWYHRGQIPHYYGFEKGTPEYVEYMKAFAEYDEGPSGGKQWESSDIQERDRSDDWDEGNTEPPNNFAVYINGKKWKVFRGRGYYADDERERAHYYQLQDWARKKSAASGKKWTVHITGEAPTE